MLSVDMLCVIMLSTLCWVHYAECRYAECRYAKCRYAECHYAECRYAECRGPLERPARDKHSSLSRTFVNYARKKFCKVVTMSFSSSFSDVHHLWISFFSVNSAQTYFIYDFSCCLLVFRASVIKLFTPVIYERRVFVPCKISCLV